MGPRRDKPRGGGFEKNSPGRLNHAGRTTEMEGRSMATDQTTRNWNLPAGVTDRQINGAEQKPVSIDDLSDHRKDVVRQRFIDWLNDGYLADYLAEMEEDWDAAEKSASRLAMKYRDQLKAEAEKAAGGL
jgi:hypothetical protein